MKRIIALFLCLVLVLSVVSCGKSETSTHGDGTENEDKLSSDAEEEIPIPDVAVGDTVYFGRYEQDFISTNGTERIEWLVIDKADNQLFLASKYGLDCYPYYSYGVSVTWERSDIRAWLNEEFYNIAFSEEEQNYIAETNVVNEDNQDYKIDGGNDTVDKVFLLSLSEATQYFPTDEDRRIAPTEYCKSKEVFTNDGEYCWYWLRSPGEKSFWASGVGVVGGILTKGSEVQLDDNAVRPVLWVDESAVELVSEEPEQELAIEATVGDIITFGAYEQDNNLGNGKEEIEWIVLDKKEDQILVLSMYGLDWLLFDNLDSAIFEDTDFDMRTWDVSSSRKFLNENFYNSMFNEQEHAKIVETNVVNGTNPVCGTDCGNDTVDKLFYLSIEEVEQYLVGTEYMACTPTPYAIERGSWAKKDLGTGWWMLRTSGASGLASSVVTPEGEINSEGFIVTNEGNTIRPAMWIEIG